MTEKILSLLLLFGAIFIVFLSSSNPFKMYFKKIKMKKKYQELENDELNKKLIKRIKAARAYKDQRRHKYL